MNTRAAWSTQDEQLLTTLFERGKSDRQIAEILERTERAIENKRHAMNLMRDSKASRDDSDSSIADSIDRNSHRILMDMDDLVNQLGRIADALELMALSEEETDETSGDAAPLAKSRTARQMS